MGLEGRKRSPAPFRFGPESGDSARRLRALDLNPPVPVRRDMMSTHEISTCCRVTLIYPSQGAFFVPSQSSEGWVRRMFRRQHSDWTVALALGPSVVPTSSLPAARRPNRPSPNIYGAGVTPLRTNGRPKLFEPQRPERPAPPVRSRRGGDDVERIMRATGRRPEARV